jgi:3-methyladenine DNA glycosylase AlkD
MGLPDPETALAALEARGDPARAAESAAYHKTARRVFGTPNPEIELLCRAWRAAAKAAGEDEDVPARVALAAALWDSEVFEARIAAAKLLTQARIADDGAVWALISSWVPQFDGWAIADSVAKAGERRLAAHPERLDEVEGWTASSHLWTRRAALVFTLGWSKGRHPSAEDLARRERILGWAAGYVTDREWFIQKAVAWWLRSLSRHDPERVRAFLEVHGAEMKPFARREAMRLIEG